MGIMQSLNSSAALSQMLFRIFHLSFPSQLLFFFFFFLLIDNPSLHFDLKKSSFLHSIILQPLYYWDERMLGTLNWKVRDLMGYGKVSVSVVFDILKYRCDLVFLVKIFRIEQKILTKSF
ncbi:hypothetical protein Scep_003316 [Stephania cephalantha]|uniref:Uncharacterized protein n=1 Tax=Stephania cephalantha TaxID=152367 RepID=A0AAP0PUA4_9MAGN